MKTSHPDLLDGFIMTALSGWRMTGRTALGGRLSDEREHQTGFVIFTKLLSIVGQCQPPLAKWEAFKRNAYHLDCRMGMLGGYKAQGIGPGICRFVITRWFNWWPG